MRGHVFHLLNDPYNPLGYSVSGFLVDLASDLLGGCHQHKDDRKDQKGDHSDIRTRERACCRYHGDQENAEALDDLKRYRNHGPGVFEVLTAEYVC